MKEIEYSVIIPVFNSENILHKLADQLLSVFDAMDARWELILVDDHSTDHSWQAICSLRQEHPGLISGYHFSTNFGQHNATLCGLQHAKGKYLITMDDDLQHAPSDIPKLIEAQKKADFELVYGIFSQNRQRLSRRMQSRFLKKSGKYINNAPGNGSSFRLISSRLARQLEHLSMRFVYLDDLFYQHTQAIGFVEVTHHPSTYRKSGYTHKKLAGILYNLFIFNSGLPLKIMTFGGLFISIFTALAGLIFILRKLFYDVPLGYTSTIVTVLFSTSIVVFSLGVIGEYLRRIYLTQAGHPAYSIDRKTTSENNGDQ
ncbi:MAG: hypothetical protein CSA95_00380 [Bacteroidetes bacterium]|nr:MAG: hypothetical protein CSA95_00380 [Bacteroidota bacterium]